MGQNLQNAEANQDHLRYARLDRGHGIFFSPISLDAKPGRILFDSTARKEKESEVSSLYRVVPTKKCERLKPRRAGMNAVSPKILELPHV